MHKLTNKNVLLSNRMCFKLLILRRGKGIIIFIKIQTNFRIFFYSMEK